MGKCFIDASALETEPDFEPAYNSRYIITEAQGRIVDGWGNGPHPGRDTSGAMCVTGEGGCRLRSFPGGAWPRSKLL